MEEIRVHFKNYIGTKTINGFPMNKIDYCKLRGWDVPANEDPLEEGYLVEYPDSKSNHPQFRGYISWSPKAAFEDAYRNVEEGCSFGHAVHLMKLGFKLARKGWNGKGMYLALIAGNTVRQAIADHYGHAGETFPVMDAIYMKTADDKLVPWLASQTDILADDWVLAN